MKTKFKKMKSKEFISWFVRSARRFFKEQTGRPFKKRIKEHLKLYINNNEGSIYSDHLEQSEHTLTIISQLIISISLLWKCAFSMHIRTFLSIPLAIILMKDICCFNQLWMNSWSEKFIILFKNGWSEFKSWSFASFGSTFLIRNFLQDKIETKLYKQRGE